MLNQSQDVAVNADKCRNLCLETQAEVDSLKAMVAILLSKVSFLLSYLEH